MSEPLAEFRTDLAKRAFSPSAIKQYLTCPRSFYIRYVLGLHPKTKAIPLSFGGAMHEALACWYRGGSEVEAANTFATTWGLTGEAGDRYRSLAGGITTLANYFKTYPQARSYVRPSEVEIQFKLAMPNDTILLGVLDRIERDGSGVAIADVKTSKNSLTDWFWKNYDNDFQMSSYYHVANELLGHCDHILVDGIKVPATEDDCFQRRTFLRTDSQMEDWMNTYTLVTNHILEAYALPDSERAAAFYQNPESCSKYSGCPFLPVCVHGLDHPAVVVDLEKSNQEGELA